MSVPHVTSGEAINLAERIDDIETQNSRALVKTEDFEAILMQVSGGKSLPEHAVTGPLTLQCLRGKARFFVNGTPRELSPGDWLFLEAGVPHSVEAMSDCTLLLTIIFSEGTHA